MSFKLLIENLPVGGCTCKIARGAYSQRALPAHGSSCTLLLPRGYERPLSLFVLGLAILRAVQAELHQCRHRRDLQLKQTKNTLQYVTSQRMRQSMCLLYKFFETLIYSQHIKEDSALNETIIRILLKVTVQLITAIALMHQ